MAKLLSLIEAASIASSIFNQEFNKILTQDEQLRIQKASGCGVGFYIDNDDNRSKLSEEQLEKMCKRGLIDAKKPPPIEGKRIDMVAYCIWQLASEDAFDENNDENKWLDTDSRSGNTFLNIIVFRDTGEAIANWIIDSIVT